jgi:hypothetical protein
VGEIPLLFFVVILLVPPLSSSIIPKHLKQLKKYSAVNIYQCQFKMPQRIQVHLAGRTTKKLAVKKIQYPGISHLP